MCEFIKVWLYLYVGFWAHNGGDQVDAAIRAFEMTAEGGRG